MKFSSTQRKVEWLVIIIFVLCLPLLQVTTVRRVLPSIMQEMIMDDKDSPIKRSLSFDHNNGIIDFNLTVVVPGFGSFDRLPIMSKSIKKIQESLTEKGNGFHCIIYAYKTEMLNATRKELPFCDVEYNVGLWTHHMAKVPSLTPQHIITQPADNENVTSTESGGTTHVAILMDDVDVYNHSSNNIVSVLTQMSKLNYNVMSGSVPDHPAYTFMQPRKECVSHETSFTDVLFTVYDAQAWECWQSQIDLDMNPSGWGYDMTFAQMCEVKIGVMDDFVAIHREPQERTYDDSTALGQMWDWVNYVAELYEMEYQKTFSEYAELKRKDIKGRLAGYINDDGDYLSNATKAELYRYRVIERHVMFPWCDKM